MVSYMQGLIPRHYIDELLTQIDIVDLIDAYIPLKKQGNNYVACCPFHQEKTPSFHVVGKKQFYYCFGCGVSGNAISFAMNYLHLNFSDAIEILSAKSGLAVPRDNHYEKNKQQSSLYHLLNRVCRFYQAQLKQSVKPAIEYLKNRQVDGESAKKFQLGYAPSGWRTLEAAFVKSSKELVATGMLIQTDDGNRYDRYRQRIMFPIHDRHGRIIGFGGRALEAGQKPKYLNSPETAIFQKNRELYGLFQILQHQKNPDFIVIVEGYLDVIALSQFGIQNAVATLGTATSTYHIQLLSKYTKQLVFCFDGDAAGKTAALRALETSLSHVNKDLYVQFVWLPEGHDPDSLIREEGGDAFAQRLKTAIPLNQFLFDTLMLDLDLGHIAGKNRLIHKMKPYLAKMTDSPYKQLMIEDLARLTHVESHRLLHLLKDSSPEEADGLMTTAIARTPLRVATALLLQNPEIYQDCHQQLLALPLDEKEHAVLIAVIQHIQANPSMTTAGLVELWRDSTLFEAINKLAAWDHQVPEDALLRELLDTFQFLSKQKQHFMITQLLDKARKASLSIEDRNMLQEMLKAKHSNEHK